MDGGHWGSSPSISCRVHRNPNCFKYPQDPPLNFINAPLAHVRYVDSERTTVIRASNHVDLTLGLGTSPPTAHRERQTQNNSGVPNSHGTTVISIAMGSGRTGAGVPVRAGYAVENPDVDLTLSLGPPGSNLNNLAEAQLTDSTSTEAVILEDEEGEVADTCISIEFLSVPPRSGTDQPTQ